MLIITCKKKARKGFEIKNLGKSCDVYIKSDTLLLADVFENFRNKFIEIYELDPACFFICNRISMSSMFKKKEVELELLIHIDMLSIIEKVIR